MMMMMIDDAGGGGGGGGGGGDDDDRDEHDDEEENEDAAMVLLPPVLAGRGRDPSTTWYNSIMRASTCIGAKTVSNHSAVVIFCSNRSSKQRLWSF